MNWAEIARCLRRPPSPALRIDNRPSIAATSARSGSGRSNGAGAVFQPDSGAGSAPARAANAAFAATGIDALLALQAVEDPLLAKRKSVRRGRSMLDVLEAVKADLLVGRVGEGRLNQLMALVTQSRSRSEPDLEALIDDIELRVRVELAKMGRFPAI